MVETVEALVDGGKATAGPPLGPALGPKGVNIGQIIAKINEKTKAFTGMKVPVKILINADKTFDIKVGTPPMSALIKAELKIDKGSADAKTTKVGNMTVAQARKVAAQKQESLLGATEKARVSEVAGNCVALGVTIDGKDPKVFQKDLKAGVYDDEFAKPL
ncbi:MAG: 50S ribosomal protein L11 [Methanomethylophilus sp.]|nr:50S ribosomal protein L11 [Methanomethylophilus sp.]MDD4222322.1 50S ribosomal protein L11 [Methanomethylophilus sp.]MDD4668623.1 50S ribosomal protein L11 [Methanomethylophilus sp.]